MLTGRARHAARRHLATLLLAAFASACGIQEYPLADAARPAVTHAPAASPRAIILGLHGFNDYHRAFDDFAGTAAVHGYHVEAFDQQGFGASRNRGLWPGNAALALDLERRLVALRAAWPDVPVFILGGSMGAAVAASALAGTAGPPPLDPTLADGLIMVAPAVWGGPEFNSFYRAVLMAAAAMAPRHVVTGQGLDIRASDNDAALLALGRDPMVIKETRLDAIAGLVSLMDAGWASAERLRLPLLVLAGGRDEIIPPATVAAFVARVPAGSCQLILYPDGWHLLLRDLQRERVWADMLAWIEGSSLPAARPCRDGA